MACASREAFVSGSMRPDVMRPEQIAGKVGRGQTRRAACNERDQALELTESLKDVCSVEVATQSWLAGDDAEQQDIRGCQIRPRCARGRDELTTW
jgi:hypothetical protein